MNNFLSKELLPPPLTPPKPTPTPMKETPMPTKATTTLVIIPTISADYETSPTLSSSAAIIHKNFLVLTITVAMLIIFRS